MSHLVVLKKWAQNKRYISNNWGQAFICVAGVTTLSMYVENSVWTKVYKFIPLAYTGKEGTLIEKEDLCKIM